MRGLGGSAWCIQELAIRRQGEGAAPSQKFGPSPIGSGEPTLGPSHLMDHHLGQYSQDWAHQQGPRARAFPWLLGAVQTAMCTLCTQCVLREWQVQFLPPLSKAWCDS